MNSAPRPHPSLARIAILISVTLAACGDRITQQQLDELSLTLADVMVAVQASPDSSARARIADSVAQSHGFSDWEDLRDEIGVVATEPERLRMLLDSTQHRIEARAR